MSLHPTQTRIRRLRDVLAGEVCRYGDGHDYDLDGRKVDAEMGAMARAGWVELGVPHPLKRPWVLTPAGKDVLNAAAEAALRREVR